MATTPPDSDPVDDPADELRLLEDDLAALREEADELRRQIGDADADASELEDRANLIVSLETHEHLIEQFEARVQDLRAQLGQG
ncbi:MAG TPA: hypothetical protein VHT30_05645 [Acidimicrobiales bacterium]|jgi:phage shock protein A|nr:hypothetical protein [Acidimicrobiales bacterium]